MTHTLYVLFAAGALGAPGDAPCGCNAQAQAAAPAAQAAPANNGSLKVWFRNVFGSRQPSATYQAPPTAHAPTRNEPPWTVQGTIQPTSYTPTPHARAAIMPRQSSVPVVYTESVTITPQASAAPVNLAVAKKY